MCHVVLITNFQLQNVLGTEKIDCMRFKKYKMLQLLQFSWRNLGKKFKKECKGNNKIEVLQLFSTGSIDYAVIYSLMHMSKAK